MSLRESIPADWTASLSSALVSPEFDRPEDALDRERSDYPGSIFPASTELGRVVQQSLEVEHRKLVILGQSPQQQRDQHIRALE